MLPESTPAPFVGVGDDATVGLEWDINHGHVELQVGNDPVVDSGIVEVGDQLVEFRLDDAIVEPLVQVFSRLLGK